MKNLLVPIDFSEYAYNACLHALQLASRSAAKVTIFHTYHIPIIDPMMPAEYLSDLAESAEKDIRAKLDNLISKLKEYKLQQHLGEVEIGSHLTMGFAVDEILLACEKLSPDLVIMGRRFTEGMTKVLLGSVTTSIVEKASLPVLVVPENVPAKKNVTDILYASEFNDEDKRALKYLIKFSKPLKAKVHSVHVVSKEAADSWKKMTELEEQFVLEKSTGLIEFHSVNSEDVGDGLLAYADSKHVRMMAMLTHRRNFFVKLFDRSLTKKIAFKTNIPLMVFHA